MGWGIVEVSDEKLMIEFTVAVGGGRGLGMANIREARRS